MKKKERPVSAETIALIKEANSRILLGMNGFCESVRVLAQEIPKMSPKKLSALLSFLDLTLDTIHGEDGE